MAALRMPILLLSLAMLMFMHGAQAANNSSCAVDTSNGKPGWGRYCAFPYESCATNPVTGRYTASPTRYFKNQNGLWTQCMQIVVLDQGTCRQQANYPNNATRCCDTMLNKLKVNARKVCWGSVASFTMQPPGGKVTPDLTNFVWENTGPFKSKSIVKFTPLKLTPATADGVEICISLRAPCATIGTFTGGKPLQYSLYDRKSSTVTKGVRSKPYECCPTNSFPLGV